ncbi:MAG: ATP-dependent 6-phosphofructokinase [Bacteroidetes bacterium]|jgi:6-phosphofructokinase 1|nr:ATP-dependent 6-phosphofructokinase [Bacteroidota bacterium]
MAKYVGVLTSGGDSPGLNAAIRGLGKAAIGQYNMNIMGFKDGFRGLMENRTMPLNERTLSGILTVGGTILGTSRHKPNKMPVGGKNMDMTEVIVGNYHEHHLDALVCMGGGGTQKNAYHLMKQGLNIITLPKTIDNDVWGTDFTFGFDTAMGIATDAIDRLHSTAISHHRIMLVEIMGHNTGWLALGAGLAAGADVILIPEIPYSTEIVAEAILKRTKEGKTFSIVAVAEGAISQQMYKELKEKKEELSEAKQKNDKKNKKDLKEQIAEIEAVQKINTYRLAGNLEKLTRIETRVTILGHLQRGGTPSAADRLLATRLGTMAARCIQKEQFGVMIASAGDTAVPVPLKEIVGKRKNIPPDHPWLKSARALGTCMGDCYDII